MSQKIIGIVAHVEKPGAPEILKDLLAAFDGAGVSLLLEEKTAGLIGEKSTMTVSELGARCELIIVLGGDGSLLQTLHGLEDRICPIVGINLGSLGFLTCVSSADYRRAVEAILQDNFKLSQRKLLDVKAWRGDEQVAEGIALNDIVISRGAVSRLIKLEASINGDPLTEYNADGLIIATPTGSTAYSLASGGPVLTPDSGVFVITPICPHVLTNRSMIVSNDSLIAIRPRADQKEVFLTIDGQEPIQLTGGDIIKIRCAEKTLPLAMLPETSFFEVLRQKLKWSGTAV